MVQAGRPGRQRAIPGDCPTWSVTLWSGHASITIPLTVCRHVRPGTGRRAVDRVGALGEG